jgi:hypothetical protein
VPKLFVRKGLAKGEGLKDEKDGLDIIGELSYFMKSV